MKIHHPLKEDGCTLFKKMIENFVIINKEYMEKHGAHIFERFNEVSEAINNINSKEEIYFVFKNSSCDDNVEYWFLKYDDETDACIERSLLDLDKYITEFVVIENNKITDFIGNIDFQI